MSADPTATEHESTALAVQSDAERRVQLAKARLTAHLSALEGRAKEIARQTAWVAGIVLLGFGAVAAAASMFSSRKRRRRSYYQEDEPGGSRRRGVGTALALTALGLLSRRIRPLF